MGFSRTRVLVAAALRGGRGGLSNALSHQFRFKTQTAASFLRLLKPLRCASTEHLREFLLLQCVLKPVFRAEVLREFALERLFRALA